MVKKNKPKRETDTPEPEEAVEQPGESPEESDAAADEAKSESESQSTAAADEAAMKERLLRAMAEAENTRKRAQREKEEAVKYANANFARDLLNVADNLRRALDHRAGEDSGTAEAALADLVAGVEITEKELLSVFERHGVAKVSPKGEKFDHQFHQAMFQVPTADHPPGTVVEVVQDGYVLRDRLLRPAMVGVAAAVGGEDEACDGAKRVDTTA